MKARIVFGRLAALALIIVSLAAVGFADTIRLKDGGIIKGRITGYTGGRFVVTIGDGTRQRQMTFYAAEIESIDFDATQTYAANQPVSAPRQSSAPVVKVSDTITKPAQKPAAVSVKKPENKSLPPAIQPETSTAKQPVSPAVKQPAPTSSRSDAGPSELNKPVELNVNVLADNTANGWTNSGWIVKKGQRIHISGTGQVSLGKGTTSTPVGRSDIADDQKLMKGVPTGALIAVIGDDNNDFIYIGGDREFTATRDGALFLGVNEGNLDDNTGNFSVKIEIVPDGD